MSEKTFLCRGRRSEGGTDARPSPRVFLGSQRGRARAPLRPPRRGPASQVALGPNVERAMSRPSTPNVGASSARLCGPSRPLGSKSGPAPPALLEVGLERQQPRLIQLAAVEVDLEHRREQAQGGRRRGPRVLGGMTRLVPPPSQSGRRSSPRALTTRRSGCPAGARRAPRRGSREHRRSGHV